MNCCIVITLQSDVLGMITLRHNSLCGLLATELYCCTLQHTVLPDFTAFAHCTVLLYCLQNDVLGIITLRHNSLCGLLATELGKLRGAGVTADARLTVLANWAEEQVCYFVCYLVISVVICWLVWAAGH
jgi:hypothetical protein